MNTKKKRATRGTTKTQATEKTTVNEQKEVTMYQVKVGYSIILTFPTLEDAERAQEIFFEGGIDEVTIKFVPIEEVQNG